MNEPHWHETSPPIVADPTYVDRFGELTLGSHSAQDRAILEMTEQENGGWSIWFLLLAALTPDPQSNIRQADTPFGSKREGQITLTHLGQWCIFNPFTVMLIVVRAHGFLDVIQWSLLVNSFKESTFQTDYYQRLLQSSNCAIGHASTHME